MNLRNESKTLILAWIKKWLFPDFTNKLTWFVAGIGGVLLLSKSELTLLFWNWLIATFNQNSSIPITLAELQKSKDEYLYGMLCIGVALLHNVANKYFIYKTEIIATEKEKGQQERQEKDQQEQQAIDRELFKQFLDVFPANGSSILLLKDHNFGSSHNGRYIDQLNEFIFNWNNAQKQFLDPELELKRKQLWDKCSEFSNELGVNSYQLGNSMMFSCIPDMYRDAWEDWPAHVKKTIEKLNDMASVCFQLHSEFVRLGRQKLKC